MRLRARLNCLERSVGRVGCPACRDLRGVVVATTTGAPAELPAICALRGRIPGRVVDIVESACVGRDASRSDGPSRNATVTEAMAAVVSRSMIQAYRSLLHSAPDVALRGHKARYSWAIAGWLSNLILSEWRWNPFPLAKLQK
jgi:hypothetical protein